MINKFKIIGVNDNIQNLPDTFVATPNKATADINGIKIIGIKNLMNKLPLTASNLYAKNLFSFIRNLYSKEKKIFNINMEDETIAKTLIKDSE